MLLSQDEVNELTSKRHNARQALNSWFADVDALLSETVYPSYTRERPL